MTESEKILYMEKENLQLRKDKEVLVNIINQMVVTLNRLVNRYVIDEKKNKLA